MEKKGMFTILIGIIALLTLAIAVMAIFLVVTFTAPKTTTTATEAGTTHEAAAAAKETVTGVVHQFFIYGAAVGESGGEGGGPALGGGDEALFNLKPSTEHPNSYIMLTLSLKYDGGEKSKLATERSEKLGVEYLNELKQATLDYFLKQTFEDVNNDENARAKAADYLKEKYNEILNEEATTKENYVLKVIFGKWVIQ